MRRVLFPLLMIGIAAGLFSFGSGAFFSDTVVDEGNVFTAGTVTIDLGSTAGSCDFGPATPGGPTYDCDIALDYGNNIDNLVVAVEVHDSSGDLGPEYVNVTACSFGGGACPFAGTTLAGIIAEGCQVLDGDVDDLDTGATLSLTLQLDDGTPNSEQGATLDVGFHFGMSQADAAPANRCHP